PKSKSLEKIEEIEEETNKVNDNPDLVEYEFIDLEIRNLFLEDAPVNDSVDVVNAVSSYIAEQLGVSMSEFMALLKAPQEADEKQREDTIQPFAQITAKILRKLGGEYAEFAEELENYKFADELENNITEATPLQTSKSNFYALLIGIDRYEPNQYYKNLNSCVRDIDRVANYFQNTLKVPQEQIWKLTSPLEEIKFKFRSARSEIKPTYENIINAFKEITRTAQAGDRVYIHYSGHGGRTQTIVPEIKGKDGFDQCLVPMDIDAEAKYLRDTEFTEIIKKMLERRLIVTIIIDSSHSGGMIDEETLRADDYVFLAACGPSEYSYEYAVNDEQRQGALTYWLLDTLSQIIPELTYKKLYDIVSAKIKQKFPNQTPMLLGESNRFVFSTEYLSKDETEKPKYKLTKGVFIADENKNIPVLQALENLINENSWIQLTKEKSDADYIVKIDDNKKFIISDRTEAAFPNIKPSLSANEDNVKQLIKRLEHIVQYHLVEGLENVNSEIYSKIRIEILGKQADYESGETPKPEPFEDPDNPTIHDGEYLFIKIINDYSQILNFTVLDLESSWEITQVEPIPIKTSPLHTPLEPGEHKTIILQMSLPEGEERVSDVFKVFATQDYLNFRWLELSSLDQVILRRKSRDSNIRSTLDFYAELLSAPTNNWSTKQIRITTIRYKEHSLRKILIVSSNPKGTSALDLDIEKREIREALKGSEFIIETRGAVRSEDLQKALIEVKPQIVHFCGHGEGTEGIVLMNDAGEINFASTQALTDLFKIFSDRIECIVLNGCYSEVQANAIAEHINYVVGMNRSILDEAAITFAEGFYRAIGAGESIKKAYSMGKVAIQFEYPDDAAIRRKLYLVQDDEDLALPTPEYLVPVLKQKANLIAIKPPKPEEKPNFKYSVQSLIGHSDWIRAIAFSPDGKYLVSGSNDRTLRLWDLRTRQLIRLLEGHKQRVKCIQISEDGTLIISASVDNTLKIWEAETGNCIRTIKTSQHSQTVLNAIAINSDLSAIATGSTSRQGTIKLWNGQTGEMINAVKAASSGIRSLAMSQDGKILVSGSAGNTVKIWHLNSGLDETYRVIPYAHLSDVLSLAIHKQILVSGGEDRTIKLWNLETAEKQQPHILRGHAGRIWSVAISPDGRKIASASGDYTVKIWDIKTGQMLETLTGHLGEVRTVAFSPDSQMLASAGDDWEIKLWQLDD
nr:caspase family protein [Pleurocapsa sp. MO_226.B13]